MKPPEKHSATLGDPDLARVVERPPADRVRRALLLCLQLVSVGTLLAVWLLNPAIRESRSLWVLFLYCFPSEFVVGTIPHEPVIIYFGQTYTALTVAFVSAIGTVATEAMNYSAIGTFVDSRIAQRVRQNRIMTWLMNRFARAPFTALLIAGLTPIPFYPFRFLVVVTRYPLSRYLTAVALSRTPRFWLLAVFGAAIPFSDGVIVGLFVALVAAAYAPVGLRSLQRRFRPTDRRLAIPD